MKPIVKEAIRRVRESGDWLLLDCLELMDRRQTGEDSAFATMRWCGRSIIGYAACEVDESECECPFCDGLGEVEVVGSNGKYRYVDCPECDGEGECEFDEGYAPSGIDQLTWRDLNGEAFDVSSPASGILPKFYTIAEAQTIIQKAKADLEKKAEAA